MIKLIENENILKNKLNSLPLSHYKNNVEFLFKCYGVNEDFCEFFDTENALICIFEKASALIAGTPENCEETAIFLSGVKRINAEYEVTEKLLPYLYDFENVPVDFQTAKIKSKKSEDLNDNCDLKAVYNIIASGFGEFDFDLWYTDTSHKIRHNLAKCYVYKNASSVTASFFGDDTVFLSQVSTLKTERHKGYASEMLHEVTGIYKDKTVYLIAEENKRPFYKSAGFTVTGKAGRLRKKQTQKTVR